MSDEPPDEERESPIDAAVIERTAEAVHVPADRLAEVLVVLDAALLGRHSEYEEYDHVTVDSRRAYAVDIEEWEELTEEHGIEESLAEAAARAHTEQARMLFESTVQSVQFDDETAGIVVGIDAAEQMT